MAALRLIGITSRRLDSQLPPMVEPPRTSVTEVSGAGDSNRYSRRSIETLIVVLAVITILGVVAGIIARVCGGRHLGGNGEGDIEGWIEKWCRSCIDSGLPPPQAVTQGEESKTAAK